MGGLHDIKKKDWERLLKKNGFKLDRAGKHQIWKHPDGRMIPSNNSSTINPCVARRMIKENRLEGAPWGWSERADKIEAKAKAAEEKQEAWKVQLQEAQARIDEENRQREAEEQARAQQLREEKYAEQKRQEAERQKKLMQEAEARKTAAVKHSTGSSEPKPSKSAITNITHLYMNEQRLKKFHDYLCAVVEFYQQNKSLKNFSTLAKQYQVKAISKDYFYQFKLDELKPGQKPDRALSDKIRLMMADDDLKRRQQMLDTFLKAQEQKESDGTTDAPETKEPTLAERIDTFEARFDLLGPAFASLTNRVYKDFEKEFGSTVHDLLGADSYQVRFDPFPYLNEWANNVEFDLTRMVFDNTDPEEVRKNILLWNDKIMHAYLTWLYGGTDGKQLKLNFDERGNAYYSDNEQLIDLLRDQHLLDHTLFVKIESWKGCAICVAVYTEAPDVLMVIDEGEPSFYTIEDNIWHSFQGNTILAPDGCHNFGGWGTRTIVGHCLRQILLPANIDAAKAEQAHVSKQMRGKLMNDINNYRDIWQMYHDEWAKERQQGMIDFG